MEFFFERGPIPKEAEHPLRFLRRTRLFAVSSRYVFTPETPSVILCMAENSRRKILAVGEENRLNASGTHVSCVTRGVFARGGSYLG
jgi:hypothetical protein